MLEYVARSVIEQYDEPQFATSARTLSGPWLRGEMSVDQRRNALGLVEPGQVASTGYHVLFAAGRGALGPFEDVDSAKRVGIAPDPEHGQRELCQTRFPAARQACLFLRGRYLVRMVAGEPVWELARRFPVQGAWTEAEYLALPEGYPRVELSARRLEVLPIPTDRHQAILTAMLLVLVALAQKIGGWARPAGLRLRLQTGRFREPDIAFLSHAHAELRGQEYWSGADLVVEVVSGSQEDRDRDYIVKRQEYAQAAIPEYWIIDSDEQRVTVLELREGSYVEHIFRRGETARSVHFAGLDTSVDGLLDAD